MSNCTECGKEIYAPMEYYVNNETGAITCSLWCTLKLNDMYRRKEIEMEDKFTGTHFEFDSVTDGTCALEEVNVICPRCNNWAVSVVTKPDGTAIYSHVGGMACLNSTENDPLLEGIVFSTWREGG